MARLAQAASLMCRNVSFPGVNEVAGAAGAASKELISAVLAKPDSPEFEKAFKPRRPLPYGRGSVASSGSVASASGSGASASGRSYKRPDETFFRAYVEPILTKRGPDGYACIHCHATHTLFNATYATALNVIDLKDPESSLILRKPTSSSESEGVLGSKTLPHGGGMRWEKDSPEYQTILRWIQGATVTGATR